MYYDFSDPLYALGLSSMAFIKGKKKEKKYKYISSYSSHSHRVTLNSYYCKYNKKETH